MRFSAASKPKRCLFVICFLYYISIKNYILLNNKIKQQKKSLKVSFKYHGVFAFFSNFFLRAQPYFKGAHSHLFHFFRCQTLFENINTVQNRPVSCHFNQIWRVYWLFWAFYRVFGLLACYRIILYQNFIYIYKMAKIHLFF